MPNFDGTGPRGMGPYTGRGFGYCRGFGWGRGRGFGRGYGWRIPVFREPTPENEKEMLKTMKAELERELKEIDQRLKETK